MIRYAFLAAACLLAACTPELTQQQAEEASIEDLRKARAEVVDIGNVDLLRDRESYIERIVTQAGPKLGWPEEDTRRAAKGIAWEGMTRDQLWWSWGPSWKTVEGEAGTEIQQWGPWHMGEPRRTATLRDDKVIEVKINPPPG